MTGRVCSVRGCQQPSRSRGMCKRHYEQWRISNPDDVVPRTQPATCTFKGCGAPSLARGLCQRHYARWRKHGTTECAAPRVTGTVEVRFWAHVDKSGSQGCWLWTSYVAPTGYGMFKIDGRMRTAYRVAYELLVGPVPQGLELDHLCRVRHCVNPSHLEPVTKYENWRRGLSQSAINARKTHCKRGHPFDEKNTYRHPNGGRVCRACLSMLMREYYQRKRAREAE